MAKNSTKQELRQHFRGLRSDQTSTIEAESPALLGHLLQLVRQVQPAWLGLYWAMAGEIVVHSVAEHLPGMVVGLPAVRAERGEMDFRQWQPGQEMPNNRYGIAEPISGGVLNPDEHCLIVVPGLAFDRTGGRLGYGGGYYDRYLARATKATTAALVPNALLSPNPLPREPFDRQINWLILAAGAEPARPPA